MVECGRIFNSILNIEKPFIMRDLGKADLKAVLALQERVLTGSGSFDSQWFYPFSEEDLSEILERKSNIAIGVYVDDELIAFRTGCFSGAEYEEITGILGDRYRKNPCFLMNGVFVDKAFRGNKLQQKLSKYCIDRCMEKGVRTFLSVVHPDNVPSIKSLKNLGFEEKARKMLFNGKYDRLILVKEVN